MKATIRTDGFEGYAERALARAKKIAKGEKIAPEMTITFEDPLSMLEILTEERIRLFREAREGVFSVSALAERLRRDPKAVRRDVEKLERAGVLRTRIESNPGHGRVRLVEVTAKRYKLQASL